MGEVSGSRVCIFLGNLPSGPALGQQTSQHQKGDDASESLCVAKLQDNGTAGTGNMHGKSSWGTRRKLVVGETRVREPPESQRG